MLDVMVVHKNCIYFKGRTSLAHRPMLLFTGPAFCASYLTHLNYDLREEGI